FGSYKNYACIFGRGINIIEGPNESGKTTLGAFIKFIFYGLGKKASTQGGLSEVKRYRSWENDTASGSLVLEYDGKKYRIERIIKPGTRAQESVKIVDLETMTECFKGEHPGRLFFGVEEEVFSQTAYVGQADGGKVNGKPVSSAIENMLFSGDESVSAIAAQKKLEDARVLLKYKVRRGGKITELEDKIFDLNTRLENARAVSRVLSEKENEKKELSTHYEKECAELEKLQKRLERADLREKLERFEYFDTLTKKADEKENEYNALLENISFDGFLPSEDYLHKIEGLASDAERVEAKISQLEVNGELSEDARITEAESALLKKIESDGGISALEEKVENITVNTKKTLKNAKMLIAGGVVFLVISATLLGFFVLPSIILAILSLGAFALSAVLFSKARGLRTQYQALLDKYAPTALENIREIFDKIEKKRYLQSIYEQNSASIKEKRDDLAKEQEEYLDKIKVLLSRCGRQYSGVSDTRETVREIRSSLIKLENADLQRKNAQSIKDSYAPKLPVADRKTLEKELEESSRYGDVEDGQYEFAKRDFDTKSYEKHQIEEDMKTLEIEITRLLAKTEDPNAISDEIAELTVKKSELEICHDGYMLAIESLSNATERLRRDVAPRLAKRASEMMSVETRGKYSRIGVSENLSLEYGVDTEGIGNVTTREIDYLSEGTKDLAYISLRLALVEVLYLKAKPPILFDESFARLDDTRLENTLSLIKDFSSSGSQVFVFTSQKRDREIMKNVGESSHILIG
ncbi:MAG: AAA family ATPase, partial [Clostridia bacterium]|nr:AAA family ATPase [Clostridia bacterium]